jgi:hypothetical protein
VSAAHSFHLPCLVFSLNSLRSLTVSTCWRHFCTAAELTAVSPVVLSHPASLIRFRRARAGVTFMPLNRIRVKDVALPKSSDVIAMIDRLKYKDMFSKAIRQVSAAALLVLAVCRWPSSAAGAID